MRQLMWWKNGEIICLVRSDIDFWVKERKGKEVRRVSKERQ
jgi:hypothetical protein